MLITPYRHWPIQSKIMIIPIISLILIVAGTEYIVTPRISAWFMEQEMQRVQSVVEIASQEFQEAERGIQAGKYSPAEAQKHVISTIRQMRYNGSEYLWIHDLGTPFPNMIMHPTVPSLDGKPLDDPRFNRATSMIHGLNGTPIKLAYKNLFVAANEVVQQTGHGFVTYEWPKPRESGGVTGELYPKLSYVKLYKPWGWVIGSGLYIDTFKAKIQKLHWLILGTAVLFSGLLMLMVWTIARSIKKTVDEDRAFAASVASGDLTKTLVINHRDELGELGQSLNLMVTDLRTMFTHISNNTLELSGATRKINHASGALVTVSERQEGDVTEITEAAREISDLINNVNEGVNGLNTSVDENSSTVMELSASIEEVVRNMELLTASVDDIGASISQLSGAIVQIDNGVHALDQTSITTASSVMEFDTSIRTIEEYANESVVISQQVLHDVESGKQAVDATITGIGEIRDASHSTADSISSLSQKAKNIGSIVTVIDEIAQQTSLLSLNASIIAAQAGPLGRSFAVVATEIKKLAERTTRSTREIGEVIKGVQTEIATAVASISVATKSITNGEQLAQQAGTVLEKIVSGVNQSSGQMREIARATKEQSRGSLLIRDAMEQIADMTAAIATSTDQQRQESEAIKLEVNKVQLFSADVKRSMLEQANVGEIISCMTMRVSDMSIRIRSACEEQAVGSQRIGTAVARIRQSSSAVRQETRIVDTEVAKLSTQTELLVQEISNFKV